MREVESWYCRIEASIFMKHPLQKRVITIFIVSVWIVNGLFCKILDLVPRHRLIVARILGENHASMLTVCIGVAELGMALWIVSRKMKRLNAWVQITVVLVMNVLEFLLASDLLLWGRGNLVFAILFALLIYYNEFCLVD